MITLNTPNLRAEGGNGFETLGEKGIQHLLRAMQGLPHVGTRPSASSAVGRVALITPGQCQCPDGFPIGAPDKVPSSVIAYCEPPSFLAASQI